MEKKLAVIGVGKLGEALIRGLFRSGQLQPDEVSGTVAHESSLPRVREAVGIQAGVDNAAAAADAAIVLLAVKPQSVDATLAAIRPVVTPKQVVISVAASVPTGYIEERLASAVPVVRAMPNTPSLLGAGMTGLCAGAQAGATHLAQAQDIFRCVGETVIVDEALMDGVTALSASGPAYLYVIMESLAEAGVKLGLSREVSTFLVAQTMLGAARMALESGQHPALLKEIVTTPAGCTIDGLMELEDGKIRVTLIKAVVAAAERARDLVRQQSAS